jgi:hypothetical protein
MSFKSSSSDSSLWSGVDHERDREINNEQESAEHGWMQGKLVILAAE